MLLLVGVTHAHWYPWTYNDCYWNPVDLLFHATMGEQRN